MPTLEGPALAWLALALVSAIVEVSIPHFGLAFVAIGAIAAAVAAFFSIGVAGQLLVFAVGLVASLGLLRRTLLTRLSGRGVPSRTEKLVGREGIVTQDIETTVGAGRVNVGGEDWAARSKTPIPSGTRIKVIGFDGIVLEVVSV